jgi:dihydroorotate dehydrogenase (fumarate)
MANLQVRYLGLKLKNPIIISSSGLTGSLSNIVKLENANAGAVVLKSLFEEQIENISDHIAESSLSDYNDSYNYLKQYSKDNLISDYLKLIQDAKRNITIPVIASINCYSTGSWLEFAKQIEDAGADALEINLYIFPVDFHLPPSHYEEIYLDIIKNIKNHISIPLALKISSSFTNLLYFTNKLVSNGARGLVLFNRYYQPDINIHDMSFVSSEIFSHKSDFYQSLRWTGIISGKLSNIELAPSTGIHDGETAIKFLLAGAQAVQVCSVIYQGGYGQVQTILDDIEKWMIEKKYNSIEEFRGKLNYKNIKNSQEYERNQFVKYFSLNEK